MAILRKNNKSRYTVVSQDILNDTNLSLKEIGLLVKMLSLPDDWEFSENGLIAIFERDGQASIRSGLKTLEENGYLFRKRIRGENGKITGVEWFLSETPYVGYPHLDFPSVVNPNLENRPQYNIKQHNTKKHNTNISKGFTPPTAEIVQEYLNEKGITSFTGEDFVSYYEADESQKWVDAKGNKVKNWKQKCLTWNRSRKGANNANRRTPSSVSATQTGTYRQGEWTNGKDAFF